MKFRLPFQIYRTGVISRSNNPGKILNKFSRDKNARKQVSKTNQLSSYRSVISNYFYRFTHLPLKLNMAKARNKPKTKSAPTSTTSQNYRLNKNDDNDKEYDIFENLDNNANSIKCSGTMSCKSSTKFVIPEKDLLCDETTIKPKKHIIKDSENKEAKDVKDNLVKSSSILNKDVLNVELNASPLKIEKLEVKCMQKPVEKPKEKLSKKPAEKLAEKPADKATEKPTEKIVKKYAAKSAEKTKKMAKSIPQMKQANQQWKFDQPEHINASMELNRLKRRLNQSDTNRNYKIEDSPPSTPRMDNMLGLTHLPKKLPELPTEFIPKFDTVPPRKQPQLVPPKHKIFEAPEMTRNYKFVQDNNSSPQRMDNIVGCKALPKELPPILATKFSDLKKSRLNYQSNLEPPLADKNNQMVDRKRSNSQSTTRSVDSSYDKYKSLAQKHNAMKVNKNNMTHNQKDVVPIKLEHVVDGVMQKSKKTIKKIQHSNKPNVNVSERIKNFEKIIKENSYQQNSSSGLKYGSKQSDYASNRSSEYNAAETTQNYTSDIPNAEFIEEKLKDTIKEVIFEPKLTPFALSKIREIYFSETTEKKVKKNVPGSGESLVANSNFEKNDTKLKFLYTNTKDKKLRNLDITSEVTINPEYNLKREHKNITAIINLSKFVEKSIDLEMKAEPILEFFPNSSDKALLNTQTKTAIIPPPTTQKAAPKNKRNYSSTAMHNYKEVLHACTDLLINPIKIIQYKLAIVPNFCYVIPTERKFSTSLKRNVEISSVVSNSQKQSIIEPSSNLDNIKQERSLSTEVLNMDYENNEVETNGTSIPEPNSNLNSMVQYDFMSEEHQVNTTTANDNTSKKKICIVSKYDNEYEIPSQIIYQNENTDIYSNDLFTYKYDDLVKEKAEILNNCIKWKMQAPKVDLISKKMDETSKCCLNIANKIDKSKKFRVTKYKIMRRVDGSCNKNYLLIKQEQNNSLNNTLSLIKTQIAHKCVLFDKISDALLKKVNVMNYVNYKKNTEENQENLECLQINKKRKCYSRVPSLNHPPKQKYNPTQALENIKTPLSVQSSDVEMPPVEQIKSVDPNDNKQLYSKKETCPKHYIIKIKEPKGPSNELLSAESKPKKDILKCAPKLNSSAIPATIQAKKFLEKIEGDPFLVGNTFIPKIDKKPRHKSKITLFNCENNILFTN